MLYCGICISYGRFRNFYNPKHILGDLLKFFVLFRLIVHPCLDTWLSKDIWLFMESISQFQCEGFQTFCYMSMLCHKILDVLDRNKVKAF